MLVPIIFAMYLVVVGAATNATLLQCPSPGAMISVDTPSSNPDVNVVYRLDGCGTVSAPVMLRLNIDHVDLTVTNSFISNIDLLGGTSTGRFSTTTNVMLYLESTTVSGTISMPSTSGDNVTIVLQKCTVALSGAAPKLFLMSFVNPLFFSTVRVLQSRVTISATGSSGTQVGGLINAQSMLDTIFVVVNDSTVVTTWSQAASQTALGFSSSMRLLNFVGSGGVMDIVIASVVCTMTAGTDVMMIYVAESSFYNTTIRMEDTLATLTAQGPRTTITISTLAGARREASLVVFDQCVSAGVVELRNVTSIVTLKFLPAVVSGGTALLDYMAATLVRFYGGGYGSALRVNDSSLTVHVPLTNGGPLGLASILVFGMIVVLPSLVPTPPATLEFVGVGDVSVRRSFFNVTIQDKAICSTTRTVSVQGTTLRTNILGSVTVAAHIIAAAPLARDVSLLVSDSYAALRVQDFATCSSTPSSCAQISFFCVSVNAVSGNVTVLASILVGSPDTMVIKLLNVMFGNDNNLKGYIANIQAPPSTQLLDGFSISVSGHGTFVPNMSNQPMTAQNENSTFVVGVVVCLHVAVVMPWRVSVAHAVRDLSYGTMYYLSNAPAVVLQEVDFAHVGSEANTSLIEIYAAAVASVSFNNISFFSPLAWYSYRTLTCATCLMPTSVIVVQETNTTNTGTASPARADIQVRDLPLFIAAVSGSGNAAVASTAIVTTFKNPTTLRIQWLFWRLMWNAPQVIGTAPLFRVASRYTSGVVYQWPSNSFVTVKCCRSNAKVILMSSDLFSNRPNETRFVSAPVDNVDINSLACFTATHELTETARPPTRTLTRTKVVVPPRTLTQTTTLDVTETSILLATASKALTITNDMNVTAPNVTYEHSRTVIGGFLTLLRLSPQFPLAACVLQRSLAVAQLAEHCRNAAFYHPVSDPIVYTGRGTVYDFRLATHRWMLSTRAENPLLLRVASLGGRVSDELLSVVGAVIGNAVLLVVWAGGFVLVRQAWRRWLWVGRNAPPHSVSVVPPLRACAPVLLYAYCALLQPSVQGGVAALGYLSHHNHDSATTGADATIGIVTLIVWGLPAFLVCVICIRWVLSRQRHIFKFIKHSRDLVFSQRSSSATPRKHELAEDGVKANCAKLLRGEFFAVYTGDHHHQNLDEPGSAASEVVDAVGHSCLETIGFYRSNRWWFVLAVYIPVLLTSSVLLGIGWSTGSPTSCKATVWCLVTVSVVITGATAGLMPYTSRVEWLASIVLELLSTVSVFLSVSGSSTVAAADGVSGALLGLGICHWLFFSWMRTYILETTTNHVEAKRSSMLAARRRTDTADVSHAHHRMLMATDAQRAEDRASSVSVVKPLRRVSSLPLQYDDFVERVLQMPTTISSSKRAYEVPQLLQPEPPQSLLGAIDTHDWHTLKVVLIDRMPSYADAVPNRIHQNDYYHSAHLKSLTRTTSEVLTILVTAVVRLVALERDKDSGMYMGDGMDVLDTVDEEYDRNALL